MSIGQEWWVAPTLRPWAAARREGFAVDFSWRAVSGRNGRATYHRLLHYIDDRKVSGERWVSAMESTTVPLAFLWGPRDPVSGGHVLARLRRRLPGAGFAVLDDVGHYPQLEAPERVGPALAGLLGGR